MRSKTARPSESRQRSFRLRQSTIDRLESYAAELGQSANQTAQRLIEEGLKTDRHPSICFRSHGSSRRAALIGTRLFVWQVINTVRASGNDVKQAADYLNLSSIQVKACVAYYADFKSEIDADAKRAAKLEQDQQDRWERQQEALA